MNINDTTNIKMDNHQQLVSSLLTYKSNKTNSQIPTSPSHSGLPIGDSTMVTISAFGKQINEMYDKLKQIDDSERRDNATQGLREIIMRLTDNEDSGTAFDLIKTLEELADTDTKAFESFFTTAAAIKEHNYNLGKWLDTFIQINDSALKTDFIRESEAIVTGADSSNRIFNQFLNITSEILATTTDDAEKNQNLSTFFSELAQREPVGDKSEYMTEWSENSSANS